MRVTYICGVNGWLQHLLQPEDPLAHKNHSSCPNFTKLDNLNFLDFSSKACSECQMEPKMIHSCWINAKRGQDVNVWMKFSKWNWKLKSTHNTKQVFHELETVLVEIFNNKQCLKMICSKNNDNCQESFFNDTTILLNIGCSVKFYQVKILLVFITPCYERLSLMGKLGFASPSPSPKCLLLAWIYNILGAWFLYPPVTNKIVFSSLTK